MAWEKRNKRSYFYRSVRSDGKVKKIYYGNGPAGELAANADALRRADRDAEKEARRAAKGRFDAVMTLTLELYRVCDLVASATLLAAGYHRAHRHAWRPWR